MSRTALLLGFCALCACRTSERSDAAPAKLEVTVAAAANLTDVFQEAGKRFEAQTGIHPVLSFASTATLTQQIENGAPFDVFAAADREHVDELEAKKLLAPGSRAIYARGVLALWIPPQSKAPIERIEDLALPEVHVIAVAKPELAPYGQATVETLHKIGIWNRVKNRIVYAENINVAKEYGTSKNADAVFTAYSLVIHEPGKVIPVDEALHQPLDQELGILASSKHAEEARKFVAFLLTGDGKKILAGYGYR